MVMYVFFNFIISIYIFFITLEWVSKGFHPLKSNNIINQVDAKVLALFYDFIRGPNVLRRWICNIGVHREDFFTHCSLMDTTKKKRFQSFCEIYRLNSILWPYRLRKNERNFSMNYSKSSLNTSNVETKT